MSQSDADEEEISEMESFVIDEEDLDPRNHSILASKLALFAATGQTANVDGLDGEDSMDGESISVDPETQARLEALLEAAGIGKLSTSDGKAFADPEVLRRLTSSVSCALDEAAAALSRMRAETGSQDSQRSLAEACSDGDIGTVRRLLNEGRSVHETTEDGESLLSLACSAGYYELAEVLLSMRANIEDRGPKGECTPLMEAASGGYKDIVELLIAHGADVNATSNTGNTALTFACCGGYLKIVEMLIEAGADLEVHNENGHTPLMEAASGGHVDVGAVLLQRGAGINTHSNEFKESALTLACYKGHLEMVRFLLEAGADQEHKTDEMHTALMEASMDGHVDVARLLLDSGAQVNMPADSFESPLTLAACGGHVELASLLLLRGANIEEVNDEGYTPLMEASREGHEEMVAILLAHGAKVNVQTEETQETALTLACCGGFLECCKLLIQAGANLEIGCSTPLMEAAQEGHLDLVKYLIQQGASVHSQTSSGDTALSYACEHGHTDVADLLLSAGAFLEQESEGGRTPLMKAARAGHLCTVQFLISQGADVNRMTRNNDHSVLSLACVYGHLSVVELLLCQGADPLQKLKDNSTMLLEAAKGGHTDVVQLLLDFPQNFMNTSVSMAQNVQVTPPISDQSTPRVPTRALPMIVPPQEPDKGPSNQQWDQKTSSDLQPNMFKDVMSKIPGQEKYLECNEHICNHFQPIPSEEILPNGSYSNSPLFLCPPLNAVPSTATVTSVSSHQSSPKVAFSDPSVMVESATDKEMRVSVEKFLECMTCVGSDKNRSAESIVEEAQGKLTELEQRIKEAIEKNAQLKSLELLQTDQLTKEKVEEMYKTREEQILKKQKILEELQKVERELQLKTQQQLKKHFEEVVAGQDGDKQDEKYSFRGKPDGEDFNDQIVESIQNEPDSLEMSADTGNTLSSIIHCHPTNLIPSEAQCESLNNINTMSEVSEETTELVLNFVLPPNENKEDMHTIQQEEQQVQDELLANEEHELCNHHPCTTAHLVHPTTPKQHDEGTALDLVTTPGPFTAGNAASGQGNADDFLCPNIDCCTESNHDTPLTLACAGGHKELVQLLISRNANIEHRDKKGFTPLILAATAGHVEVVSILLDANADLESQSERTKDTPLSLACSGGGLEVVELLLARGANKEHRNVSDYTPLSLAASGGYVKIIELLLEAGAEINSRTGSKLGISPLMLAAMNGHTQAVQLLLDRGADINAQIETNRNTALTLACFQGRHEVVNLLVDRWANVEHRAKTGLTPLMEAASGGYAEVGRVLLGKGADVNAAPVPSSRDTALTIAADKGHYRFCELVLADCAQVDVRNKKGNTPMWLACNGGHLDVAQLLLSKGADPNAADNRNITPLMAAFRKGHVKVTLWLVTEVSQFPSDAECMRYIATISDRELLKRCHMCMECIVTAKDRQAQEANKNASELLEEINMEKCREENRKERAARKREKRRIKRKQKQQLAKKDDPNADINMYDDEDEDEKESIKPKAAHSNAAEKKTDTKITEENAKYSNRAAIPPLIPCIRKPTPETQVGGKKEIATLSHKQNVARVPTRANDNIVEPLPTPEKIESRSRDLPPSGSKKSTAATRRVANKLLTSANVKARTSSAQQHLSKSVTTVTSSPGKKGQRSKEDGWKEVVRKSKRVMVASNLISRVIGRGGCNINAIREVTGAHIDIDKQRKGGQERTVTIRGPTESIRHAHMLITELTKEDKSDQDINAIIMKAQAESSKPQTARKVAVVEAPLPKRPAWTVPPSIVAKPISTSDKISPIQATRKANNTERPLLAVCTVQGNINTKSTVTSTPTMVSVRKALFSSSSSESSVTYINSLLTSIKITEPSSDNVVMTSTMVTAVGQDSSVSLPSSTCSVNHNNISAVSFMSKATDKHSNRPVQPVAPMVANKSVPVSSPPFPLMATMIVPTNHTLASMQNTRHIVQATHVTPQKHHVMSQANASVNIPNSGGFRSPNISQYTGPTVVPSPVVSMSLSPATNRVTLAPTYSPFNNSYSSAGRSSIWSSEIEQGKYDNRSGIPHTAISQPLSGDSKLRDPPNKTGYSEMPTIEPPPQIPNPDHSPVVQEAVAVPAISNDSSAEMTLQIQKEMDSSNVDADRAQYDRKIWPIGTERAISQWRGATMQPNADMEKVGIWSFGDAVPDIEPTSNWSASMIPETQDSAEIIQDAAPSSVPIVSSQADNHISPNIPLSKAQEHVNEMEALSKIYPQDPSANAAKISPAAVMKVPLFPQNPTRTQVPLSNPSGLGTQPPIGSHLGGGGGGGMHGGYSTVRHGLVPRQPIGAHLSNGNQMKNPMHQQKKYPNQYRELQPHLQQSIPEYSQISELPQMSHSSGTGWQQNMMQMQFADVHSKYGMNQQYGALNDGMDTPISREMFLASMHQPSFQYQAQQRHHAIYNVPYSSDAKGLSVESRDAIAPFQPNLAEMDQMKPGYHSLAFDSRQFHEFAKSGDRVMEASPRMNEAIWDSKERQMLQHQIPVHYEMYNVSAPGMNTAGESEMRLIPGSTGVVNHVFANENQTDWKW